MKTIEDFNFSITMDYYSDTIFVRSLSDIYKDVYVNILDENNNSIYGSSCSFGKKDTKYWFKLSVPISNFSYIKVALTSGFNIISEEKFGIKNKYGAIIKPIIVHICQELGVGDVISVTPLIRKLYKAYERKIDLYCFDHHMEFFKNNIYINSVKSQNESYDSEKNEVFRVFDNIPNAYYYSDMKQLAARSANMTLKEDELSYDYQPEKFDEIVELPKEYICLNPRIIGPDRSLELREWQYIVDCLNDNKIPVVTIGKEKGTYYDLNIRLGVNLAGDERQKNLSQTWHIINSSKIFVGFDTGMYIFAGTTDTHILLLGWYGDPYYHQAVRNGSRDYKFTHLRGACDEYCLTDPKFDVDEWATITIRHPVWTCPLNKNFSCKPTPDMIVNEIKKIYYQ